MKKKLTLNDLTIASFVTTANQRRVLAGERPYDETTGCIESLWCPTNTACSEAFTACCDPTHLETCLC